MGAKKCSKCASRPYAWPLEPCDICRTWLEKFRDPKIMETDKIAALVAEISKLNQELERLKLNATKEATERKEPEPWDLS